ncbi:MAG: hypothetical protein HZA19_00255 [Nitrospirae bacterium]|nr:hypothetical protein [Nitrospirota bacterium]
MKNIHLILTIDYEVFGNGSGCVQKCVLQPAERMIRIAELFGAPLTFFVETMEFQAMYTTRQFHNDSTKVSDQLRAAVKNGHDAQLHLHPQWRHSRLDKSGNWTLDMSRWRIGDMAAKEINDLLTKGKTWLESICYPVSSTYRCLAFRAGGWCIQPSNLVMAALKDLGFSIDSSVVPESYTATKGDWYNFRHAPDLPFWNVSDDVCQIKDTGMIEIPIVTGKVGWSRHLSALQYSRGTENFGLAPGCKGSYTGPDGRVGAFMGKLSKFMRLGHVMLDFSTMPAHVLITLTNQWIDKFRGTPSPIPIIAIAHTKNFTLTSGDALKDYLYWARNEGIIFSTFKQWLLTRQ